MDGYRRLARTRGAAGAAGADHVSADPVEPGAVATTGRRRRVAGTIRLAAFVGVLALIVGTSVSLASANGRDGTADSARDTSPAVKPSTADDDEPTSTSKPAATSGADPSPSTAAKPAADAMAADTMAALDAMTPDAADAEPAAMSPAETDSATPGAADATAVDTPAAEPAAAAATPSTASAPAPTTGALPFTGEPLVAWPLLGGAVLTLLGMLAQIAGGPLPARARARR